MFCPGGGWVSAGQREFYQLLGTSWAKMGHFKKSDGPDFCFCALGFGYEWDIGYFGDEWFWEVVLVVLRVLRVLGRWNKWNIGNKGNIPQKQERKNRKKTKKKSEKKLKNK